MAAVTMDIGDGNLIESSLAERQLWRATRYLQLRSGRSSDPRPCRVTPSRARRDRRIGMAEAYCVKDKMKVEIQNPQKITMKNGKPATKGTCPKCGGSVFRIGA